FQIWQQLMAADGGVQVSGVRGTAEDGTDHVLVGGQGHVQLARPGAAQHRVLHKGRLVQLAARQGIDRQRATGGHEALQGTAPAAVRVDGALRFPLTIAEKVLDDEVKGLATIVLHKEPRIRLDQRGLPWPDAEKASCEGEVEAVQVDARDGNAGEPLAQELHGSTTTHAEQQYPLYTRERGCGQGEQVPYTASGLVPGVVLGVQHAIGVETNAVARRANLVPRTALLATVNNGHAGLRLNAAFYGSRGGRPRMPSPACITGTSV